MATPFSYLTCATLTDVGRKRKNNEDAFAVFPEQGVFCVADGMGGAEDGEVASAATMDAVTTMLGQFDAQHPLSIDAMEAWIIHAVNNASNWIFNRSKSRGKSGTGTTFVGVCFDPVHPDCVLALHAGDSRVYQCRGKKLKQITRDHSLANAAGIADERELNPKFRSVILRAVGLVETVEVEVTPFTVEEGDTIIICSDGLSKMVEDAEIGKVIAECSTVDEVVKNLVEAALKNGGKDNVTVEAVRVGSLPASGVDEAVLVTQMPPQRSNTSEAKTEDSNETPNTQVTPHTPVTPETPPTITAKTEDLGKNAVTQVDSNDSPSHLKRSKTMWLRLGSVAFVGLALGLIVLKNLGPSSSTPIAQHPHVHDDQHVLASDEMLENNLLDTKAKQQTTIPDQIQQVSGSSSLEDKKQGDLQSQRVPTSSDVAKKTTEAAAAGEADVDAFRAAQQDAGQRVAAEKQAVKKNQEQALAERFENERKAAEASQLAKNKENEEKRQKALQMAERIAQDEEKKRADELAQKRQAEEDAEKKRLAQLQEEQRIKAEEENRKAAELAKQAKLEAERQQKIAAELALKEKLKADRKKAEAELLARQKAEQLKKQRDLIVQNIVQLAQREDALLAYCRIMGVETGGAKYIQLENARKGILALTSKNAAEKEDDQAVKTMIHELSSIMNLDTLRIYAEDQKDLLSKLNASDRRYEQIKKNVDLLSIIVKDAKRIQEEYGIDSSRMWQSVDVEGCLRLVTIVEGLAEIKLF